MASTVPDKSQPLHNFNLPYLKWNKDGGQSSSHSQNRRRSTKSPARRPNPSPASPLRQSPLRDSVPAPYLQHQSPLRDSVSFSPPEHPDCLAKPLPIRGGGSSKSSPGRERVKNSPIRGNSMSMSPPEHTDCFVKSTSIRVGESSKFSPVRERVKNSPICGDSAKKSSKHCFGSESDALVGNKGGLVEYKRSITKNSAYESRKKGVNSSNSERAVEKSEKKITDVDAAGKKRSKILIKLPLKNKVEEEKTQEGMQKVENNEEEHRAGDVQEEGRVNNTDEEAKTWNLRPRRPIRKCLNVNGAVMKNNVPDKKKASSPSRIVSGGRSGENGGNCGDAEKKEKRKLSIFIALTKEEIEEDIYSMSGLKPSRRPKKRAKNVQKQVDYVFPGMWLISITPDSYKVSENSLKV